MIEMTCLLRFGGIARLSVTWTWMTPRCQFAPFSSLHDSPGWAVSRLMWNQSFESCTPPHKLLAIPSHTFGVYLFSYRHVCISHVCTLSYLYIVMSGLCHVCSLHSSSHIFSYLLWAKFTLKYSKYLFFQIFGPNSHYNIQNILFQIFHIVVFDSWCAVGDKIFCSLFDLKYF